MFGNESGKAQGVNVAVPVTVPEGCVGRTEVRVRWKDHVVWRLVKMVRWMEEFKGEGVEIEAE